MCHFHNSVRSFNLVAATSHFGRQRALLQNGSWQSTPPRGTHAPVLAARHQPRSRSLRNTPITDVSYIFPKSHTIVSIRSICCSAAAGSCCRTSASASSSRTRVRLGAQLSTCLQTAAHSVSALLRSNALAVSSNNCSDGAGLTYILPTVRK